MGACGDSTQTLGGVATPLPPDSFLNRSPAEASRIHSGDTATVTSGEGTARGGGESEALGPGVVTSIGVAVDSASRAVAVRARLTVPTRGLRIGESVGGRIVTGVNPPAVVIPVDAPVPGRGGKRVF